MGLVPEATSHRDPLSDPSPPLAPAAVRWWCLTGIGGLALFLGIIGGCAVVYHSPDFEYFYKAGAWMASHGTFDPGYDRNPDGTVVPRGNLDWYLPFTSRLMSLLGWMPFELAGFVWILLNLTLLIATLRMLGREFTDLPGRDWPVTQLLPLVACVLFWYWEFRLNQIDLLTLTCLLGSFVAFKRGRSMVSGFWLGVAVLLKVTPGLFVLWFLLKRQYRTVVVALVTIALAGPVGDALCFGQRLALEEYHAWFRRAVSQSSQAALVLNQTEMDWRNQSLAAVASRWLHATNYTTHFDNDPRIRFGGPPRYINIVDLPLRTIAGLVSAAAAVSLAAFVWMARRPARDMTPWQLRIEWALCLLLMLWLMPVLRRYHFILLTPAVTVALAGTHHIGLGRGSARAVLVGLTLLVIAQVAIVSRPLTGDNIAEAGGTLLAAIVVLGIPLLSIRAHVDRRMKRESRATDCGLAGPADDSAAPVHAAPLEPLDASAPQHV